MESGLVDRECGCVEGKNHSLLGLEGISEISLFGLLVLQVRKVRFSDPPKVTQPTGPFPSPLTWFKSSTSLLGLLFSFMWQAILFQDSHANRSTARTCLMSAMLLHCEEGVCVPLFESDGPSPWQKLFRVTF